MSLSDFTFHAFVACVAAGAAYGVRRKEWPAQAALVTLGFVALFGAAILANDAFHLMRFGAWLLFVHLPLLLGLFAIQVRRQRSWRRGAWVAALLLVAIGVDAFIVEPRWLETTTLSYRSARLREPLRIVVLADLQTDEVASYEAEVFARVAALEPDLLLLPGDFLQIPMSERAAQAERLRPLLARVRPRLGSWAVRGNVDAIDYDEIFTGTPVRAFTQTETVELPGGISLTGLSLEDSFDPRLTLPLEGEGLRIVMGHAPDFALGRSTSDLLIAGHTHGGQVQLPLVGPLITLSRVPRSWAAGLTGLPDGRTLVVSRGVGMERGWAPRLRFLCRPQLVVIDASPP